MMNPTPSKREVRQLRRDNLNWPVKLKLLDSSQWEPLEVQGVNVGIAERVAVWRSRDFMVQVFYEGEDVYRLSIMRTDWDENAKTWKDGIAWEDLQRLKNEAGFAEDMAVEIFPPYREVVNVANMRHLWILPAPLPFAWRRT